MAADTVDAVATADNAMARKARDAGWFVALPPRLMTASLALDVQDKSAGNTRASHDVLMYHQARATKHDRARLARPHPRS